MVHLEKISALVLNMLEGISPRQISSLMETFHSASGALLAGPEYWEKSIDMAADRVKTILNQIPQLKELAEREFESARELGIDLIVIGEKNYPLLLKEIPDPPPIIYIWGEGAFWDRPAVALVGSRRCSFYGEKVAKELAGELALNEIVTVSGLARGIDSVVHRETVAQGGSTWAVLGSGLTEIYPPENKKLAESIREKGALISEFPLKMKPLPYNFPRRNRIISGLAWGCVVIEGDEKSGALITARLAADQNREVFAVPGSIHSPLSRGPNLLIKSGAKLVQDSSDIFEELPQLKKINQSIAGSDDEKKDLHLDPIYENILSFIGAEPVHKEFLLEKMGRPAAELISILLEMELKGLVRTLPGGLVGRA